MITIADTLILDQSTGEVLAQPGDVLDDELLYRLEMLAVSEKPRRPTTYLEALLALPLDEQEVIFQSIDEGIPFQHAVVAFCQLKAVVG
jgi:hypothetical protein